MLMKSLFCHGILSRTIQTIVYLGPQNRLFRTAGGLGRTTLKANWF